MDAAADAAAAAAVRNGEDADAPRERSAVPERLQRREQERLLEAERRKQSRQEQEVAEERRDVFAAAFARERAAVEALLRARVHLGLPAGRQRHVLLSDLADCTVRLRGNPNTLRLSRARRCTVLCGPVSTSVFLQDCSDCLLAVACQQLRVHATADTRVFLHVTSRAVLEDCRGIRVAPFAWAYPGLDADFAASGLDRARNHWDQVDDFDWLARDQPSPNWSILPEDERELPVD